MANRNFDLLIETSANQLYLVRSTNDDDLAHVWFGIEVKKVRGGVAPKAKARETLVRKDGSAILGTSPIDCGSFYAV